MSAEQLADLRHLAHVYRARSTRPLTPDWSAERKRQDTRHADTLEAALAALTNPKQEG